MGLATAAAIGVAGGYPAQRKRLAEEASRRVADAAALGPEHLKAELERIESERKARIERAARAAARNPRNPDAFDFHWHAAMCAAESARLQGRPPASDLPWEPAFEVEP